VHTIYLPARSASYQKLITGFAKNTTTFQFFRQRNDVKVEEPNLAPVPIDTWIRSSSTGNVCCIGLPEQVFIPLSVHTAERRRTGVIV